MAHDTVLMPALLLAVGAGWGGLAPLLARRVDHVLPSDPATTLVNLIPRRKPRHRVRTPRSPEWAAWHRRIRRARRLEHVAWAAVGMAATALVVFGGPADLLAWHLGLVWTLLLGAAIDQRTSILPDALTVPLILAGMVAAVATGGGGPTPVDAAATAAFAYGIVLLTALLMYRAHPGGIGGGDYKLLAAMGAWLGLGSFLVAMLVSVVLFGLVAMVTGRRANPYGPALAGGTAVALVAPPLMTAPWA